MRDVIQERLDRINARLAARRAAGATESAAVRTTVSGPNTDPSRLDNAHQRGSPAVPADDRARKQAMWEAICEHEPELAQLLREARAKFGKLDVTTLRIPARPDVNTGPDPRPFNAIRIEIDLRGAIDKKSRTIRSGR